MKNLKRLILTSSLLIFSLPAAFSQLKDNYKIISNQAEIPRFELTINPVEFYTMKGINFGAGANVKLRPISRIGIDGRFKSMLYTNPYRQEYDGPNKSSFKSIGGISASVIGEFIWRKKGLKKPIGKFFLSRSTENNGTRSTTTTSYLPMKPNDLVERTLRAGIIYDNFPIDFNTTSATSFAFGVGKRKTNTVQIEANGQLKKQSTFSQYAFEVLVGIPNYIDPTIVTGNYNIGLRFIYETQFKFKNAKDIRGWKNFDVAFELGAKPGNIAYLGITMGIPTFSVGKVDVPDRIEYKEIKEPKRFIGRLLRFI